MKDNAREDHIFDTKHWRVALNTDQAYLGRGVVVLKRKCGDIAELIDEEWLDFRKVVQQLESAVRGAFKATMFNWTCLMNDAYQAAEPKPQVHWHVRPRYRKQVSFAGVTFGDTEFGHHYVRGTNREVPEEVRKQIIGEIQKHLPTH